MSHPPHIQKAILAIEKQLKRNQNAIRPTPDLNPLCPQWYKPSEWRYLKHEERENAASDLNLSDRYKTVDNRIGKL